jgi:hypothetical protein
MLHPETSANGLERGCYIQKLLRMVWKQYVTSRNFCKWFENSMLRPETSANGLERGRYIQKLANGLEKVCYIQKLPRIFWKQDVTSRNFCKWFGNSILHPETSANGLETGCYFQKLLRIVSFSKGRCLPLAQVCALSYLVDGDSRSTGKETTPFLFNT